MLTLQKHHIIIGDGVTAAEFAKNTDLSLGDRLSIIGSNVGQLGRGLAYQKTPSEQPWHLRYLLNSPAESVDPKFGDWVIRHWTSIADRMQHTNPDWLHSGQHYISNQDYAALNVPREIFGDYNCWLVDLALNDLEKKGVSVERVNAKVSNIEYDSVLKRFIVFLESGEKLRADSVDIATGGTKTQSLFEDDGQYRFAQLYGNEESIAGSIAAGGAIVCLGSNAAMLDALRLAQSVLNEEAINLIAVSPSGKLPEALIPSQPRRRATVRLNERYDTASALCLDLSNQMDVLRVQGYGMADMRGPFKAAIINVGLETLLPNAAEAKKVIGLMERLFFRGSRDSLGDFHRLSRSGKVRLISGSLASSEVTASDLSVQIKRSDGALESLDAGVLINCSGAGKKPKFDLVTEQLLAKKWLVQCSVSNGLEVGEGLEIGPTGLRYLSPSVTSIGGKPLAFSLYDVSALRERVSAACKPSAD